MSTETKTSWNLEVNIWPIIIIVSLICYTTIQIVEIKNNIPEEYDYILNLDDETIEVITEDGDVYIIEPDNLEEFITKDQL